MDEAKRELVRGWLIKGRNDLTTAPKITTSPDGPLDTAINRKSKTLITGGTGAATSLRTRPTGRGASASDLTVQ